MSDRVKTHRGLTTEFVVDTALDLADSGGIDAVSLRRLATMLEVTPMAIYRHVRDKDDLLDLMADRLLGELDLPAADAPTWQEALRQLGTGFLAVVQAHPAAPFLLSRPFESATALRVSETILAILSRAGFSPTDAVRLLQVLTGMLLGPAIHRATYGAAWRELPTDATSGQAGSTPPSPTEFPHLWGVADELMDWSSARELDRLLVDLWVAGVHKLADERERGA